MSREVVIPTVEETLALQAARVRHLESLEHGIEPFSAHPDNPCARVSRTAIQIIGSGVWTPISFDNERFDTDNIWAIANPTTLICRTAGYYLIIGQATWAAVAGGIRVTRIFLNGVTDIASVEIGVLAAVTSQPRQNVSTIYELAFGDFLELSVYQNSGGNVNVLSVGNYTPEFMMARVG